MTAFALFWQITIRKNAYMLASAGSSASFIVPVVASLLFFGESFTLSSCLSIVLIMLYRETFSKILPYTVGSIVWYQGESKHLFGRKRNVPPLAQTPGRQMAC